ncbi:hypothetical protein TNCV_5085681 [Trichonephila clavipes]|uniref:Uncharacterized protein n=1 Tax=Trichonephila clavipes TaxID=2585209 RepID=A0A8X6SI35_TRICX|nr:hypothetical protein TNCV_5085681 [Trichonephila clavipes]
MYKYPIVYRGMNAAKVFMEVAIKEAKEIEYLYSNKKSMIPLTKEQQDVSDSSSHCSIGSGSFTKEDWKEEVDGIHLSQASVSWHWSMVEGQEWLNASSDARVSLPTDSKKTLERKEGFALQVAIGKGVRFVY